MSTILDRISQDERTLVMNADRGELEEVCRSLGLNYNSVRAAKSRMQSKQRAEAEAGEDTALTAEEIEWMNAPAGPYPEIDEVSAGSYYHDKDLSQYVTRLKRAPESIVKSEAEHRRMLRRYSSMGGKGASRDEIVREFGLPWEWFREYARIHGWQRSGLPFTNEELETRDADDLADEAALMMEVKLRRKIHEREWEGIKRDAARWRQAEAEMYRYFDAIPTSYQAPQLSIPYGAPDGFAVILSTADLHFGKFGYGPEVGQGYDRATARQRLIDTTTDLLARILHYGRPGKFIVVVGGDDEHVDTIQRTTTGGTPQDVDGSTIQAAIEFSALLRDYLELIRQTGVPMDIYLTRGNHNSLTSVYRAMEIEAFYRTTPGVTVNVTPQARVYVLHGDTLIGLSHGDGPKAKDLPMLMAHEAADKWGQAKHRAWFLQHLHHEAMLEFGGVKLFRMPSLSGADVWHANKGYTLATPGAAAYIIEHGVAATVFSSAM